MMRDEEYPDRATAKLLGFEFFFTGSRCVRGHVSKRALSGKCHACILDPDEKAKKNQRRRERLKNDPQHAERERAKARAHWHANPEYREQHRKHQQSKYQSNPEYRARHRAYQKAWGDKNSDSRKQRRLESYQRHKEHKLKKGAEWSKRNRDKKRSYWQRYMAAKTGAMPKWLSNEQRREIDVLYMQAAGLHDLVGERYEVDHIMPLRGRNVCGLHVPWNLRVITKSENAAKRNKLPPEKDWLAVPLPSDSRLY